MVAALDVADARRITLRATGLAGRRVASPAAVLARIGAVQLDTISVLARSQELTCYARTGPVGRQAVEEALWGSDDDGRPRAFEYWAHAASVVPIALWPVFAFRRRRLRSRWADVDRAVVDEVRRRLVAEGPLTATELGGAKQGGGWWDWSPVKVAVERMLGWGDVVCTTRRGWRRVYDLAERAVPAELLGDDLDDDDCMRALVACAARALGVGTVADLADHFRLPVATVRTLAADAGLVPVSVAGWPDAAWAHPAALEPERVASRSVLVGPFDPLVWDRKRTLRLWGLDHRLEAYVPSARRVHGYYAMPVLTGGRIVGRVDPARAGTTLVARRVGLHVAGRRALSGVATALREAAAWVGCDDVALEVVDPPELRAPLAGALARG